MAGKAASEITLPDALTLPTREFVEVLTAPLRAGLDLYENQAKDAGRDALEGRTLRAARRLLKQLETALPEAGE